MFDEIDVRMVVDNGPKEIIYLPEYNNVFNVVFDHVVKTVLVTGSSSLPVLPQYWSLRINSKKFGDCCESIRREFKVIPCSFPAIDRRDCREGGFSVYEEPSVDKRYVKSVSVPCDPYVSSAQGCSQINEEGLVVGAVVVEAFIIVDSDTVDFSVGICEIAPRSAKDPSPARTKVGCFNIPRKNFRIWLNLLHFLRHFPGGPT
jgi:hypothetical protein